MKKPYPTKVSAEKTSRGGRKTAVRPAIAARRATPPEIFIKCVDRAHPWRDPYARAHLRNRKGYVYLTWRDGERVRSYYLGKAPRKSPTADPPAGAGAGDLVRSSRISPRRPKQRSTGNPQARVTP